jgi:GNAT superfamily N-acetyltransferase
VNVRRIRVEDTDAFREVRLRALVADPDAFASSYEDEVNRPTETWETWAALSSTGPDQVMYLVDVDGDPVGLAGAFRLEDNPRRMHLISMWVDPAHRRGGIGRALTDAIVAWARRSDADDVVLWVVGTNEGARRLYEEAGFAATGKSMPLPSNPELIEHEFVRPLGQRLRMPDGYAELEPLDIGGRRAFVEWVMADRTARTMERTGVAFAEASQRVRARIGEMIDAPPGTSHHFYALTAGTDREARGWLWMIERRRDGTRVMAIEELVVFEEFRGYGLAAAAVDDAILQTEMMGIPTIEASIPIDHPLARRIAEACGFTEIDRTASEISMRFDVPIGEH